MAGQRWISKATSKNKGALTRKAKAAGQSVTAFSNKVTKPGSRASTTTKREANLAKTLRKFH